MLKKLVLASALIAFVALAPAAALAQTSDTTINFATVIYNFLNGILPAVIMVVAAFGAWVAAAIKTKTGLDIEFLHRDALEKFLDNQAGRFLAPLENLEGLKLDVGNKEIARLAQEALNRIPDAFKFFNLSFEDIARRIIDKIGMQTASAIPAAVPSASEVAKAKLT